MDKLKLTKTIVPLALLFVVLLIVMPRAPRFSDDYRKGSPWSHETLVSQFDFPIRKTDAQMDEERISSSASIIPYFKYSAEITNRILKSAEILDTDARCRMEIKSSLQSLLGRGVVSDDPVRMDRDADINTDLIYIQKDKRAAKCPAGEVYRLSDAKAKLLADISGTGVRDADSLLRACGAYELVVPNLIFDKNTTALVHSERQKTISPTVGYVSAGQIIVSEGEIVTSEIAMMLDSYKHEFERSVYGRSGFVFWFGSVLVAAILVLLLYFAIYFASPEILKEYNRYTYMVFVSAIASISSILLCRFAPGFIYLFPFTVVALYLQSFYRNRVIFPVYVFSLLPLLIFARNGMAMFVMYLAAGTVAIYTFRFFNKGWKQFVNAAITFGVLVLSYFAFWCMDLVSGSVLRDLSLMFVGSALSVAAYPLIFLFERLFDLVSQWRLSELCEHSSPLIKELESKAPGTFQHSLQVMNMSASVARAIGANEQMVRAGAMYHDIGKIANPRCFIENESLSGNEGDSRYHDSLTPLQSAKDIISHVSKGVEFAKANRLPGILTDFIRTHHGTTTASFFLSRQQEMGGEYNENDFRYSGPLPRSREQIILMLCDSIEAAARSMKSYSQDGFSSLVEKIVDSKIASGQFSEADVSLREINIMKEVTKNYLAQIYHERIQYPTENKQ